MYVFSLNLVLTFAIMLYNDYYPVGQETVYENGKSGIKVPRKKIAKFGSWDFKRNIVWYTSTL